MEHWPSNTSSNRRSIASSCLYRPQHPLRTSWPLLCTWSEIEVNQLRYRVIKIFDMLRALLQRALFIH